MNHRVNQISETSGDADESNIESEISFTEMTPKSKTNLQIRSLGLDRNKQRKVRRALLMSNTVVHNFRSFLKQKKKRSNSSVWTKALAKYRCMSELSRSVGVGKKKVNNLHKTRKAKQMLEDIKSTVVDFLEREDNSTTLPGKSDTKKVKKENKQKHVLTDYMLNLYEKFLLEFPQIKISRTSFYRLRPAHIILTNFASRRTCLCLRHQNLALKIKALNSFGIKCSRNPDVVIKAHETNETMLRNISSLEVPTIQYRQWKRVQDGDKLRMKEVDINVTKDEFIKIFDKDMTEFREHVLRINNQYTELRSLRANMPENELLIWMDFAENFSCASVEEVQSAYWNSCMVSLHTMVVYYPNKNIQSYVAVSGILSHNASVVYTILKKLVHELKQENPDLKRIHSLSDSPTSQYRNKTMFQYIAMHHSEFGLTARWSYLESGHGKGPCDGLGASVKRSADNAIKQGTVSIQSAGDFFDWSKSAMDSGSKVKFYMYDQHDLNTSEEILAKRPLPEAIKGTFKVHYVIGTENVNEIYTRNVSCYCQKCILDVSTTDCTGYTLHKLCGNKRKVGQKPEFSQRQLQETTLEVTQTVQAEEESLRVDSWVAAIYNDNKY